MTYPATTPRLEARTAVPALAGFDPAVISALAAALDRGDQQAVLRLVGISLLDVRPAAGRA